MSKSRDRDKKGALACGLSVLAVAGLIVLSWDELRAWYVGYRFIWLNEGAVPTFYSSRLIYRFVLLNEGAVPTFYSSQLINASGEVAVKLSLESLGTREGRWSLATREVLPLDVPLASDESASVVAINDAGDMVGMISEYGLPLRLFLWTKDVGVRDVATLGGELTVATAINERRQVAGWSISRSNKVCRAFLWSAGSGISWLGSLAPGKDSRASDINEAGWVVGGATAADGSRHPFLWKRGAGMQDLGLPSGFSGGDARDINNQGEVLVNLYTQPSKVGSTPRYSPFVWRENDGLVKLPAPPNFDNVWAVALNYQGIVLLEARPSDPSLKSICHLIVNGALKELPSAPGAKSTQYYGLNDKGWLVGVAQTTERAPWRGFVALPVR